MKSLEGILNRFTPNKNVYNLKKNYEEINMLFLVKITVDVSILIIAQIQTEIFGKKYNINLVYTSRETNTKYQWWWRTNVLSMILKSSST